MACGRNTRRPMSEITPYKIKLHGGKENETMEQTVRGKSPQVPLVLTGRQGYERKDTCKVFQPLRSGTWLVTEAEKQSNGDWLFFCYGTNGHEWEWEYITLSELTQTKVKVFGYRFPLERDLYIPDSMTIGECLKRYGG